jgi:hypothetical protein
MAEDNIGQSRNVIIEPTVADNGVERARERIAFKRATIADTRDAFGSESGTESKPRRQRTIGKEKRSAVTISDTRPELSAKVKGKGPSEPKEDSEEATTKRPVGRPRSKGKAYPTITESGDSAKLLLSFIEIASVTTLGPTGEMSEWERGFITPPLQRIIARIPVDAVQKGGLVVDIGALTIGFSLYFGRTLKGVKLPSFGKKRKDTGVQEDTSAPVSAAAHTTVDDIRAGDVDGLAVPIPTDITRIMNGAL